MMSEYNVFGKKSYEFAVGAIKASSHSVISEEKLNRLKEADLESAQKMLAEFGYPAVSEGKGVNSSIDGELAAATAMIRELAPDEELTNLLFFEQDALNLKMYLKAKLIGKPYEEIKPVNGGFAPEIIRACVMTEDFSLMGEDIASALEGIENETDPCKISCIADRAMYSHAVLTAKKKRCEPLEKLLEEYGKGKNRLTAMRMKKLGLNGEENEFAFLPVDFSEFKAKDSAAEPVDIISDVAARMKSALNELGFYDNMGAIAQYYFLKKNEAAALRLMFAQKSLGVRKGGIEE